MNIKWVYIVEAYLGRMPGLLKGIKQFEREKYRVGRIHFRIDQIKI